MTEAVWVAIIGAVGVVGAGWGMWWARGAYGAKDDPPVAYLGIGIQSAIMRHTLECPNARAMMAEIAQIHQEMQAGFRGVHTRLDDHQQFHMRGKE